MKQITRDISLTLIFKFILLFILWWVCVKDAIRPTKQQIRNNLIQSTEVKNDSRY